jgi:hypothetical protein
LEVDETKDNPLKILPGGKVANKRDWFANHVSASRSFGIWAQVSDISALDPSLVVRYLWIANCLAVARGTVDNCCI